MPIPFAALIPAIAGIAGGLIQRGQSRRDIGRQNQYNSPLAQVNRTRAAGLPMASLGNNIASQQSSLPITNDGGLTQTGQSLTNHISFQSQLAQLEILKAEIELKRSEATKNAAEVRFLMEGKGQDTQGTNLTNNLRAQQEFTAAQADQAQTDARVKRILESNTSTRLGLENTKLVADIRNTLASTGLVNVHTEGAQIDNQIKSVVAAYQERMSDAELSRLLKSNNLLDESIQGAQLDNALATIRNRIAAATETAEVNTKNISSFLAALSYDRVSAEFKNYQQYQEFVDAMQDVLRDPKKQGLYGTMDALVKFLYTSVASPSGQVSGQILQGMGGGNGTFETGPRYIHIHND